MSYELAITVYLVSAQTSFFGFAVIQFRYKRGNDRTWPEFFYIKKRAPKTLSAKINVTDDAFGNPLYQFVRFRLR
jgi:hypothetical protein